VGGRGAGLSDLGGFTTLDPLEDTERHQSGAPGRVDDGFTTLDPLEDTESHVEVGGVFRSSRVSPRSIRLRILKGAFDKRIALIRIKFHHARSA